MGDTMNGPRPVDDRPSGDDTVASLLRLAGHRPPIPVADAEVVKKAARAEWIRTVAAEKQRARIYRAGGTILALAAAVILALNAGLGRLWQRLSLPAARVVAVAGAADGLSPGAKLWPGDAVRTAPADEAPARVALALESGAFLRIDAGSRLRLASNSAFELSRGAVYLDSQGSTVEIRTGLGVVTNIGTQFEVRLAPDETDLRVRVRSGRVSFENPAGKTYRVDAGNELVAGTDGTIRQTASPSCGSSWEWILALSRPFSGETVEEVLEWVANEAGWQLR